MTRDDLTVYGQVTELAQELASGLTPPDEIRVRYRLSPEEFEQLLSHPDFERMLDKLRAEWLAVENTERRLQRKAEHLVEQLMPELYRLAIDPSVPPQVRVAAFSEACRAMTALRPKSAASAGSEAERVVVNIHIGDQPVTVEAQTADAD